MYAVWYFNPFSGVWVLESIERWLTDAVEVEEEFKRIGLEVVINVAPW